MQKFYKLKPPKEIYKNNPFKVFKTEFKFRARSVIYAKQKRSVEKFLTEHKIFSIFFDKYPNYSYYMLFKGYVCSAFSHEMAKNVFIEDIVSLEKLFKPEILEAILFSYVTLFSSEGLEIRLSRNIKDGSEGICSLLLVNDSKVAFNLSFSLGAVSQTLCVVSVQGIYKDSHPIKDLTKQLFGLRPQIFIVECAKIFAETLGLWCVGVSDKFQMSTHKRAFHGGTHIQNYNELYSESNGGEIDIIDEYFIKLIPHRKDMSEIASKKRSMYKKRYLLLDDLKNSFEQVIKEICL